LAAPKKGTGLIRSQDEVVIRAQFSALGKVSGVELEYFVDDVERTDEPRKIAPMTAGADGYEATLPPMADNSIVRYRIFADRGAGREVVSPRPSDPYAHHAYFVSPVASTPSPVYQAYI